MDSELVLKAKELFFEAICTPNSVIELASAAQKLMNWPVLIGDDQFTPIFMSPAEPIGYESYDDLLHNKKVSSNRHQEFIESVKKSKGEQFRILSTKSDKYPLQAIFTPKMRFAMPVAIVFHIPKHELDDDDKSILDILVKALTSECLKMSRTGSIPEKRKQHKLSKLLSIPTSDMDYGVIAGELTAEFNGKYIMAVAMLENDSKQSRFISFYSHDITDSLSNTVCTPHGNNLAILIGQIRNETCRENILEVLEKFSSKYDIHVGISNIFSDITDVPVFYDQAVLTGRLGLHVNPQCFIYNFEQLEPLQMFQTISHRYDLRTFINPVTQKILEYDTEYNTEYLSTLRAYLVTNKNTKKSIQLLSIHQNTLLYRIQKIRDIFDINFEDGKLMLVLLCDILLIETTNPALIPLIED